MCIGEKTHRENILTRLISFLGFGIAAAALPQMAAAQSVTLDPGLYEVSEKVVMTFRPEKNKVEDVSSRQARI